MLMFLLFYLLISNAVTLRQDKSIIFSRVAILGLIFSTLIAFNNLFIKALEQGVEIYGGGVIVTPFTLSNNIYIFILLTILFIFPGFLHRNFTGIVNPVFIIPFIVYVINKNLFIAVLNLLELFWCIPLSICTFTICLYIMRNIHNDNFSWKVIFYIIITTFALAYLSLLLQLICVYYKDFIDIISELTLLYSGHKLCCMDYDSNSVVDKVRQISTMPMEQPYNKESPYLDSSLSSRQVFDRDNLNIYQGSNVPRPTSQNEQRIYEQVCKLHKHCFNMKQAQEKYKSFLVEKSDGSIGVDSSGEFSAQDTKQHEQFILEKMDEFIEEDYQATKAYENTQSIHSATGSEYLKKEEFEGRSHVHLTHDLFTRLFKPAE